MVIQVKQTAANSIFEIDYRKALNVQQQPWTLKSLGKELPDEKEGSILPSDSEERLFGSHFRELKQTIKELF